MPDRTPVMDESDLPLTDLGLDELLPGEHEASLGVVKAGCQNGCADCLCKRGSSTKEEAGE